MDKDRKGWVDSMTFREYLVTCDEFEQTVLLANLARRFPNYDSYSPSQKSQALKELSKYLDEEMPIKRETER